MKTTAHIHDPDTDVLLAEVKCDVREIEGEYLHRWSMLFWVIEQHDPGMPFYDRILVRFSGGRESLGVIRDYHTRMKAGRADITEPIAAPAG